MNLLQLCEPTFLYICKVNRILRNGGKLSIETVKADVDELRENIAAALAQENADLNDQYQLIELSLVYFIDSMLVNAGLSEWNSCRIAVREFNRRAGDNEFFDFLSDTEAEAGDSANARLAFYYCCIGLGYTGMYEDDLDKLHEIMRRLEPRVRPFMDRDVLSRITPEAYAHNLEIIVSPDNAPRFVGIILLASGTVVAIIVTVIFLYIDAFSGLSTSLRKILSF
jgi:type VI protein secretion system component VasF